MELICDMYKGMILERSKPIPFFEILKAGLDYGVEVQEFQPKTRLFEATVGMADKLEAFFII